MISWADMEKARPQGLAPKGDSERLPVGTRVQYKACLRRDSWFFDTEGRAWVPYESTIRRTHQFDGYERVELLEPCEGVVVGWRYPYSGWYTPGGGSGFDYEPGWRTASRVHYCFLVADIAFPQRSPWYVLMEDVEVIDGED